MKIFWKIFSNPENPKISSILILNKDFIVNVDIDSIPKRKSLVPNAIKKIALRKLKYESIFLYGASNTKF